MEPSFQKLSGIWAKIYDDKSPDTLNALFCHLHDTKQSISATNTENLWYKNAVVYALYVDLFAENFALLTQELSYFENLGDRKSVV